MTKFVFDLQMLLDAKEKIEEEKKIEYSKAVQCLNTIKDKLVRLNKKLESIYTKNKSNMNDCLNPKLIQMYNNYIVYTRKCITNQQQVAKEQEQVVAVKRQEMLNAIMGRKSIEKLKEKKYIEFMKEENRKEQKIVDEIISYKYSI